MTFVFLIEIIGRENEQDGEGENVILKNLYKLCCLSSKEKDESEHEENGDIVKQPKVAEDFLYESTFHRRYKKL